MCAKTLQVKEEPSARSPHNTQRAGEEGPSSPPPREPPDQPGGAGNQQRLPAQQTQPVPLGGGKWSLPAASPLQGRLLSLVIPGPSTPGSAAGTETLAGAHPHSALLEGRHPAGGLCDRHRTLGRDDRRSQQAWAQSQGVRGSAAVCMGPSESPARPASSELTSGPAWLGLGQGQGPACSRGGAGVFPSRLCTHCVAQACLFHAVAHTPTNRSARSRGSSG